MKFDNQLRYAVSILRDYAGDLPFHIWLRNFFRENPQMGARDRKIVGSMAYAYFRTGQALASADAEARILAGLFLCQTEPSELLGYFRPAWNGRVGEPMAAKFAAVRAAHPDFDPARIFPWADRLSPGMDLPAFSESFLRQPDLFLRVRPGHAESVAGKLTTHGIAWREPQPHCLAFPGATKLDSLLAFDQEVVVQDLNSQNTGELLPALTGQARVWDCCAGSGGKSLMLKDRFPDARLTVSDIRKSILQNLQARFAMAGITGYQSVVADLAGAATSFADRFDLVLADVPCTGSGTWARTPDALAFFSPDFIPGFAERQRRILQHVAPGLDAGGKLLYITCSVFREENEDVVAFAERELGLRCEAQQLLTGYADRADTLFAALLARRRDV